MIVDPQVNNVLNVQPRRQRRQNRCGFCRETGHNRQTCPHPDMVEQRRVRAEQRRAAHLQHIEEQVRREREQVEQRRIDRLRLNNHRIFNNNNYILRVYYGNIETSTTFKHFFDMGPYETLPFRGYPEHTIICIPYNSQTEDRNYQTIELTDETRHYPQFELKDFIDQEIHLIYEYKQAKNELDQWKETAIKSLFLINELKRLGADKNPNYEAIMDMVEDIPVPEMTEFDKENAGVPSTFTNMT